MNLCIFNALFSFLDAKQLNMYSASLTFTIIHDIPIKENKKS